MAEPITWSVRDGVLDVVLDRGPCNELGEASLVALEGLVRFLDSGADGARALVLRSAQERGFCAGADLRALHEGLTQRADAPARIRDFVDRIHAVMDALDTAPLVTVAAVHGVCFGGGFELALTCDVIVADASARFCFPELRLGIIPGFGGLPRLARDCGNAVVRDLLFTGRSLNAQRAHAVGIVSQAVARGEHEHVARLVAEQAARFDPRVVRRAKPFCKPLPRAELDAEKRLFCELVLSDTTARALGRFVTSTDPRPYLP